MKRILTIQDVSCIGKCSLTVALPVLSVMGIETAVLPTAILSTHTAFRDFVFHDLTDQIAPIADHWQRQGMTFDALYSGYLGSAEQVDLVCDLIKRFKTPENFVLVDPAMADFGRLYTGFTPAFVETMKGLCAKADLILPNLTEACLLLGIPYEEEPDEARVREMLIGLTDLGCASAILTGVSFEAGQLGAAGYDRTSKTFFSHFGPKQPQSFHGTGDLFASVVTGGMTQGLSPAASMALAVDFTGESIRATLADPNARWYGVNFEEALPRLAQSLRAAREARS